MDIWNILFIVFGIVAVIFAALYFLNRWASKKMGAQQSIIDKTKMEETIYVIEKKRDNIKNVKLQKAVVDAMPKYARRMKMNFVLAKIGPRIVTLMCEKRVFEAMPIKKSVRVELAGMYIIGIKGMKTEYEMKQMKKLKKEQKLKEDKTAKK